MANMPMKPLLVFVLAVTLILPSFGQTFGEISGVIFDSTGAVVPGVTITVTNPQTNFTRTAMSNESGNYNFPALAPGVYNVKAEISGFQSEVRNGIELQVQQTARIDFRLNVGALTEAVEVSAGAPLLNTENATVGTVIENKRIVDLPLNGRSFISLVALSPNVITGQTANTGWANTRGNADRGTVSVSIAGMRREYTFFTLDGVSNTDFDWNTVAFLPSIDALQEFKVQTGVYSAEFGRAVAQINILTKSGTNQFHGTVFEFLRNNKLDALPYAFTSQTPVSAPFKWNQYGFAVGGRILKDHLFFISNYEGFKLRNQAQEVFSVPSVAMRRGDFSELLPNTIIKDPANNNQPFPGNIIPTQRLNRIALGLLEFYPPPNVPNAPGRGLVSNYLALENRTTDKNQFTQRIDWTESTKSNWSGRYSWQGDSSVSPALHLTGQVTQTNVKQAMISNTRVFSPAVVNEFRTGYMGYANSDLGELAYKRDVTKEVGLQLFADVPPISWGTPFTTITGFSNLGEGSQTPYVTHNHTFQFIDNISWIRGSHSIKFGGEVRRDRFNAIGGQVSRGQLNFQGQATGYAFADYMLGYLRRANMTTLLGNQQLRQTAQAYFINDNWKVRPNLTIEAGLRYEHIPVWNNKGNSLANIVVPYRVAGPPVPLDQHPYLIRDCAAYGEKDFYPPGWLVRFDPAIQVRCDSSRGNNFVNNDLLDFAPRLGLAWSLSPKWTVRAGFGLFYAQDESNTYFDAALNMAGKGNAVQTNNNLTLDDPLGQAGPNVCGVSRPLVCITLPTLLGNDPDRRTPYVEQYEVNIQRELRNSTVLEVGYLGSQGHKLQRSLVYNDGQPGTIGSVTSRFPFPEFGSLQITTSGAVSNYHSGSVKLTRRLSNGLSYMAGYTYSKSLDDGSSPRPQNTAFTTSPQNGLCVRCEYSPSDSDSPHRFVASTLYELPLGKGKRRLNQGIASQVLGGWQLTSIFSKSSGFPIQIVDGIVQANNNSSGNRPDAVLGASRKLDYPTTDQWFNIQSVRLQPFGQYGNLARNTHRGPGVTTWDFSTLKNFNFAEATYLQFRFECFNCANHPAFGDPGNTLAANRIGPDGLAVPGTGTFGRITSTRPGIDMRRLQFGLKLVF